MKSTTSFEASDELAATAGMLLGSAQPARETAEDIITRIFNVKGRMSHQQIKRRTVCSLDCSPSRGRIAVNAPSDITV